MPPRRVALRDRNVNVALALSEKPAQPSTALVVSQTQAMVVVPDVIRQKKAFGAKALASMSSSSFFAAAIAAQPITVPAAAFKTSSSSAVGKALLIPTAKPSRAPSTAAAAAPKPSRAKEGPSLKALTHVAMKPDPPPQLVSQTAIVPAPPPAQGIRRSSRLLLSHQADSHCAGGAATGAETSRLQSTCARTDTTSSAIVMARGQPSNALVVQAAPTVAGPLVYLGHGKRRLRCDDELAAPLEAGGIEVLVGLGASVPAWDPSELPTNKAEAAATLLRRLRRRLVSLGARPDLSLDGWRTQTKFSRSRGTYGQHATYYIAPNGRRMSSHAEVAIYFGLDPEGSAHAGAAAKRQRRPLALRAPKSAATEEVTAALHATGSSSAQDGDEATEEARGVARQAEATEKARRVEARNEARRAFHAKQAKLASAVPGSAGAGPITWAHVARAVDAGRGSKQPRVSPPAASAPPPAPFDATTSAAGTFAAARPVDAAPARAPVLLLLSPDASTCEGVDKALNGTRLASPWRIVEEDNDDEDDEGFGSGEGGNLLRPMAEERREAISSYVRASKAKRLKEQGAEAAWRRREKQAAAAAWAARLAGGTAGGRAVGAGGFRGADGSFSALCSELREELAALDDGEEESCDELVEWEAADEDEDCTDSDGFTTTYF